MSEQLRSELIKVRTTRTVAIFALVAVALALIGSLAEGLSPTPDVLAQEDTQRRMIASAATNGAFLAMFVGLLMATNEFRYGTIRPTLLFEPRRRLVLAAKLIVAALVGVLLGALCVAVAFGAGLTVLAARDVDFALTDTHTVLVAFGPIATSALGAMFGVTVGALVRNQIGALVILAVYSLSIDALLFYAVPSVGRFLPGQAGNALSGMPDEELLAPGVAGAVLIAWMLLFVAAARVQFQRSDV
jgi:hypothetical protein